MMTGTDMPLVSYRGGGPALVDLLGGQGQVDLKPLRGINFSKLVMALASD
jgi:hypothetical protein